MTHWKALPMLSLVILNSVLILVSLKPFSSVDQLTSPKLKQLRWKKDRMYKEEYPKLPSLEKFWGLGAISSEFSIAASPKLGNWYSIGVLQLTSLTVKKGNMESNP